MLRALVLAVAFVLGSGAPSGQALTVLHIKVVLIDPEQKATPVPNHALLVSANPASAAPRRILTALDGTADVKLRPGNYTVESDRPVVFHGQAYQWTQTLDVAAGSEPVLELTAGNAEIAPAAAEPTASAPPLESDPASVLPQWQSSVVALWTPTAHASGFVIDARGLVATNQQVVGAATAVEVQLAPDVKVMARVLAADASRDVAILWIDPKVTASVRPVPLGCGGATRPEVISGQELFTIGVPLRQDKGITSALVSSVETHAIYLDATLALGSAGGPVFAAGGGLVGITSLVDDKPDSKRDDAPVVPIDDVCEVLATAENKMKGAAAPDGTHLPVEPVRPFPVDTLANPSAAGAAALTPYQMSTSGFDVTFITPVVVYKAQHPPERTRGPERRRGARVAEEEPALARSLMEFNNWSDYVADLPPVLLVRVTPKLVEGFWTTVARGAARTQGVDLPPIKHVKSGFLRMRAFCGTAEVTPIHPFKLEQRVGESDAIYEGLYVFDPGALGPHCGAVKLVLYSEKEPDKEDARVVDAKLLQQIWQDFAAYRALPAGDVSAARIR